MKNLEKYVESALQYSDEEKADIYFETKKPYDYDVLHIAAIEGHECPMSDDKRKQLNLDQVKLLSITFTETDLKELIQQAKFALEEIREKKRELRRY